MSEVLKHKIRRDLSRWSRKLLVCIGLETIGRQLVGEESWETLYPVQADWAQDRTTVSDFDPTQVLDQDFATEDSPHIELDPSVTPEEEEEEEPCEEKNDFLEKFYHLLPYWYFINRAFGLPGTGAGNASEDLSNNTQPLLEALDAQRLNSLLLLQSLKQQQLQVQAGNTQGLETPFNNHVQNLPFLPLDSHEPGNDYSTARFHPETDFAQRHSTPLSFPCDSDAVSPEDDFDQPLDLTQKNKNLETSHSERNYSSALLEPAEVRSNGKDNRVSQRTPQKSNCKPPQRSGRGYTSFELEAALRDIQSGKLGTRRAAVIYGIPRSTLRNKVYKLGRDRIRSYHGTRSGSKAPDESPARIINISENATVRHGLPVTRGNFQANLSLTPPVSSSFPSSHSQGGFQDGLLDEDETEEEEVKVEEISHEKKVLKEWLRTKLSRQNLLQSKQPSDEYLTNSAIKRASSLVNPSDCSDDDHSEEEESGKEALLDPVLKVPALLNKSSRIRPECQRSLRSHKEDSSLLKFRQSYSASTPVSTITSSMEVENGWKQPRSQDSEEESETEIRNGSASQGNHALLGNDKEVLDQTTLASSYNLLDEKKSRPKRGKYRNYDRDALLKAVKAVQNGEMSVHRAGSFFGVPHSTLEYKVKERHLLRRPKKKGAGSPKSSQKSSPESSLSGSEPSHSATGASAIDSMSLPSSARENLSRLLNIGSFSSPLTFDPPAASRSHGFGKRVSEESQGFPDNYRAGVGSGNLMFHIDDLIRHNLDNTNLLDLTKKS